MGCVGSGQSELRAATFYILVDQEAERGPNRNRSTAQPSVLVFSSLGPSARPSSQRYQNFPKQLHPLGTKCSNCGRGGAHFQNHNSMVKCLLKSWGFSSG